MTQQTLYLIRGLPGSGKSTLAQWLVGTVPHVEADQFLYNDDGVYEWSPDQSRDAHIACQRRVYHLMQHGTVVIAVANTFTRQWEMEPYRQLALRFCYTVVELTVESGLTDVQLASRTLHNVPVETIARMRARWEVTQPQPVGQPPIEAATEPATQEAVL